MILPVTQFFLIVNDEFVGNWEVVVVT